MHDKKLWIAGGIDANDLFLSSVAVLDLAVGRMEMKAQSMQRRRAVFSLVEVNGELYAVGGDFGAEGSMSIEKKSNETGEWEVIVGDYEGGGPRFWCASVAVGSKIFVFGGRNLDRTINNDTWDAFDVLTGQWASATIPEESRKMPRDQFTYGRAVFLPALHKLT